MLFCEKLYFFIGISISGINDGPKNVVNVNEILVGCDSGFNNWRRRQRAWMTGRGIWDNRPADERIEYFCVEKGIFYETGNPRTIYFLFHNIYF